MASRYDWLTFEVLQRWHLGDVALMADDISESTTLHMGPEDVKAVLGFLSTHQLVQPAGAQSSSQMAGRLALMQGGR